MMKAFYEPTSEHVAKLSGPWCCSYSGGKDSTSVVTWLEWLRRSGKIDAPHPQLVQSDTTVEDPGLNALSREMMTVLTRSGWQCAVVEPLIHEKLYNRILGIGNTPVHPGGGRFMRWCTRSTKIDPMKRWRKEHANGGLAVTGLRRGESRVRDEKLNKGGCVAGGECGVSPADDNTFGPILHWTTCNVWAWLCADPSDVTPNIRNVMSDVFDLTSRLYDIYEVKRGQDGFDWEGPTYTSARFGCCGCPAIESGHEAPPSVVARYGQDSPLCELYGVWFQARQRDNRCVRHKADGTDGRGPIKMEVRKRLFEIIKDIQRRAGVTLIDAEDEAFIGRCWRDKVYPRGWSEADELVRPRGELFEGAA